MPEIRVHPAAFVDPAATLGEGVEIGPGAVIGPDVVLGDRVSVGAHAVINGYTRIGEDTRIWPGAVLGDEPQDLKYGGEPSYTEIGARCRIREFVTIHRGCTPGSSTVVGSGCFLMACSHVGHNSVVEDGVILVNGALLAGHVFVGQRTIVGGNAGVHQFVRLGRQVMIGGTSRVTHDVPPYFMLKGDAEIQGLNLVALKRGGVEGPVLRELRRIYAVLVDEDLTFPQRVERARELASSDEALEIVRFVEGESKRGYQLASTSR